jgi:hypothetical protein
VIEQMRQDYPAPPTCRMLRVSVSGYYAWLKRSLAKRTRHEDRLESDPAPDKAWCGDIRYIAAEGCLHLAGPKDFYSGEIVGDTITERMTKGL